MTSRRRNLAAVLLGLLLAAGAVAPASAVDPSPSPTSPPEAESASPTPSPLSTSSPEPTATPAGPAATPSPDASVAATSVPTPSPVPASLIGPAEPPTVHAEMLAANAEFAAGWPAGAVPDAMAGGGAVAAEGATAALPNGLAHEVLGYLPYWMLNSSAIATIDFDRLSTVAYFSVGANPDGTLLKTTGTTPSTGWAGWTSDSMTQVTNLAHARGVRVVLTVTFMSWSGDYTRLAQLLNDPARRAALAAEISSAVKSRNADGVNVDFEPVPASLRDQFTAFVRELKARLVADGAGSYLTVATMAYGATSTSLGYDVVALTAPGAADALMVMGYDFHWSGSMRAGAVAPLRSPYITDVTDALNAYLARVPANRIIWGVPYYGREWSTDTTDLNALTNRKLTSMAGYYTLHRNRAATHGRRWDHNGEVPWYAYWNATAGTWVSGYYDDPVSLGAKYALARSRGVAGIGIWHLGMDGSLDDLTETIDLFFRGVWFTDIVSSPFRNDILWIGRAGITAGCNTGSQFCPTDVVSREQMASFLGRALALPATTRDWFDDDESSGHEADINRLAQAGITLGCGVRRFCPSAPVSREQMASFLARALALPPASTDYFTDDGASSHQADINRLAAAGITNGCESGRFCPTATVTREQMAAFLRRSLDR